MAEAAQTFGMKPRGFTTTLHADMKSRTIACHDPTVIEADMEAGDASALLGSFPGCHLSPCSPHDLFSHT